MAAGEIRRQREVCEEMCIFIGLYIYLFIMRSPVFTVWNDKVYNKLERKYAVFWDVTPCGSQIVTPSVPPSTGSTVKETMYTIP
jgi:hypothetical protein